MNAKNTKPKLSYPQSWTDNYDAAARELVCRIIDYLNEHNLIQAWLSTAAAMNKATLNRLLAGKYPSPPMTHLETLWAACESHTDHSNISTVPFVPTTLYKLIVSACKRTRNYRNFGVVTGYSGVGKTRALEEYARVNPNTILIKPNPMMSQGALLDELITQTGAVVNAGAHYKKGSRESRFIAVCNALRGSNYLLVLDEANTVSAATLETLRRIRDLADIGILLVGTEHLNVLIKPEHGQFDQLRNRVSFWPKTVESIGRQDADAVALAGFPELDGLSDKILNRLWDYHQGNMRVLTEMLIPAIRDYGLSQDYEMSVNLIDSVAAKVLFIKAAPKRKAA